MNLSCKNGESGRQSHISQAFGGHTHIGWQLIVRELVAWQKRNLYKVVCRTLYIFLSGRYHHHDPNTMISLAFTNLTMKREILEETEFWFTMFRYSKLFICSTRKRSKSAGGPNADIRCDVEQNLKFPDTEPTRVVWHMMSRLFTMQLPKPQQCSSVEIVMMYLLWRSCSVH
jgi:hypothetical protein